MAHIKVPDNLPGILGPMAFSPETHQSWRIIFAKQRA